MPRAISESAAARYLGIPLAHLRRMRKEGRGPSHVLLDNEALKPSVSYLLDDLDDFLLSRRVEVPVVKKNKRIFSLDPSKPIF